MVVWNVWAKAQTYLRSNGNGSNVVTGWSGPQDPTLARR